MSDIAADSADNLPTTAHTITLKTDTGRIPVSPRAAQLIGVTRTYLEGAILYGGAARRGVIFLCTSPKIYALNIAAECGGDCDAEVPIHNVDDCVLLAVVRLCEERVTLDDALVVSTAAAVESARLEAAECESAVAAAKAAEAAAVLWLRRAEASGMMSGSCLVRRGGGALVSASTDAINGVSAAAAAVKAAMDHEAACVCNSAAASVMHENRTPGGGITPFYPSELRQIAALESPAALLDLLAAADYLGAAPVMDLCCAALAATCRGLAPAAVAALFSAPGKRGKRSRTNGHSDGFSAEVPPWRPLAGPMTVGVLERAAAEPGLGVSAGAALRAAAVWLPRHEAARVEARRRATAGLLLVTCEADVLVRRMADGAVLRTLPAPDGVTGDGAVAALLDLGAGAVAVCYSANKVDVFDFACGAAATSFAPRLQPVTLSAAAAIGDGRRIAAGYEDGTVCLVDFDAPRVDTTHQLRTSFGVVARLMALPFAAEGRRTGGRRIAMCNQGAMCIGVWDVDSLTEVLSLSSSHCYTLLVIPLWDAMLLSANEHGALEVWDSSDGRRVMKVPEDFNESSIYDISACVLSDNAVMVVTFDINGSGSLRTLEWDGAALSPRGAPQPLAADPPASWTLATTRNPDVIAYADLHNVAYIMVRGPDGMWAQRGEPMRMPPGYEEGTTPSLLAL